MTTVFGDLLKIDRESRLGTASVTVTKVIHLRPPGKHPLPPTVLLKTRETGPYHARLKTLLKLGCLADQVQRKGQDGEAPIRGRFQAEASIKAGGDPGPH